jgi:hypothetical protein
MNVTTLPNDRQRKPQQRAPRSGGRTTEHEDFAVQGANALKPQVASKEAANRATQGATEDPPRLRVAPPAPVVAPRAPFVALVLVLVLVGVLGILVLNTKIAENAFVLDDLHQQQSKLDHDQQQLQTDIAEQESPNKLAARASQLGLVPSRNPAFLLLPDGTKLQMPGPGGN